MSFYVSISSTPSTHYRMHDYHHHHASQPGHCPLLPLPLEITGNHRHYHTPSRQPPSPRTTTTEGAFENEAPNKLSKTSIERTANVSPHAPLHTHTDAQTHRPRAGWGFSASHHRVQTCPDRCQQCRAGTP